MRSLLKLSALMVVAACNQSPPDMPAAEPTTPAPGAGYVMLPMGSDPPLTAVFEPQWVDVEHSGEASLLPPPKARDKVRLTIDQLRDSLAQVTGGMIWTDKYGNDRWESYLTALAVPDYEYTTQEDLSITLLYDKLLGDAARDMCPKLLQADSQAAPEDRVFLMTVDPTDTYKSAPEKVKANMSRLLLRYHGRKVEPDNPQLERWRFMVESTMHFSKDPVGTWTAVCVALITHPHFSGY